MPAVPVTLPSTAVKSRVPQISGAALSLLLHAVAAWWLLIGPWSRLMPPEPETMVVEMVALPTPPATSTTREQMPEPALPPAPPPPPPQLQEAPLAERSAPPPSPPRPVRRTAPSQADDSGRTAAPQRGAPLPSAPAESQAQSAPFERGRVRPDGASPETVASQAVQDFVLAQIARHWIIDFRGARFRNIVLTGRFVLLPNGMLAPPFGKNDPWNLRAMVSNYDQLSQPGGEAYRTAVETFLQAARQAQPFRLPPDGKGEVPRVLPMNFRLGDL